MHRGGSIFPVPVIRVLWENNDMRKRLGMYSALALILSFCVAAIADQADTAECDIPFRFAEKEEGTEMMLANMEYYAKFTPNKLL